MAGCQCRMGSPARPCFYTDERRARVAHPPKPMPPTLNDIADRLAASGLLSVGEIATLLAAVSGDRPETPQQFIETLMQRGALTGYQAQCILDGRIEHLVLGNYVVLDKLGQGGMGLV